jgi:hypothetical protein
MRLIPGTRVGPYEIVGLAGVGGMGEVYRAHDSRLKRDVALKALPEVVAGDPDRLARFEREAQTLAALNHPNIAQIHGVEEAPGGGRALVMEYVEGEELSAVIDRAKSTDGLPLDDILPLARQIASALEAAHQRGIVHRDLKPSNIKITAAGTVKVLDFGLAKATPVVAAAASGAADLTLTTPAVTAAGIILGTAAYMSPEQARGKEVDKRADIWAFGVVLYEMLTARALFTGQTVSDVIAAVLTREIDWRALPPHTPPPMARVLRRCLERDPNRRLRDIGDALIDLEDAGLETAFDRAASEAAPRSPTNWSRTALLMAASGVAAAVVMWAALSTRPAAPADPSLTFAVDGPPDTRLTAVAVSPDGRSLAYAAESPAGVLNLWVRNLHSRDVRRFEGTQGARDPFWSPDSLFIAFFTEEQLLKIELSSGVVAVLNDDVNARGGAWGPDGVILIGGGSDGLKRVNAAGGRTTPAVPLDVASGENAHRYPSFLPDGKHVLFYSRNAVKRDLAGLWVVSLETGVRKPLAPALSSGVFVAPGFLLYRRDRYLVAQPFDSNRLEFTADAITVAEDVWYDPSITAAMNVSASTTGTVVFRAGGPELTDLRWFNRAGEPVGVVWEPKAFNTIAISPDGTKLITALPGKGVDRDTWLYDLPSGPARQVTSTSDLAGTALFSSDGTRTALSLYDNAQLTIWLLGLGSGLAPELAGVGPAIVTDWRGDQLIFQSRPQAGETSLYARDLRRGVTLSLVATPANEQFGVVSPDGRWMAYSSDATGQWQIYVEPFPTTGERWRITNEGGHQPRWHPKGGELFYLAPDRRLMSARVGPSARAFQWDAPRALFQTAVIDLGPYRGSHSYAVASDGERFLILTSRAQGSSPAVAILNWPSPFGER